MSSQTQAPRTAAHPRETFINWLALLALLALGVSCSPADAGTIPDAHAGSLLLKSSADAAPLEALRQLTRMHATVTGNVARVEVTQTFTNQSSDWMEGMYVFPLPTDSAVDELRMQIGERTIVGEIRERAAAHAAYEAARSEGRQASLVDQQRPNMFTTSVANIPPAGTITVSIAYLDSIAYRDGRYTLSLPLSITPRYTPGQGTDADGAVVAAAAAPAAQVSGATQSVAIQVDLEPGFALAAVQSLYHAITETASANGRRISFSASEAPADRDFELTWKPQVAPPGARPGERVARGAG
jgi:Ca-activated chloride channel family protein